MTPGEMAANLRDPTWRIGNLYAIRDRAGKIIPFRPTPEQAEVLHVVFVERRPRILILKARQLGMSTLIAIIILDALLWRGGIQASIIDQTAEDAKEKLREKVRLGFENLSPTLKERFDLSIDRDTALGIRCGDDDTDSVLFAGKRARGGTNQILHVSEWGAIAQVDVRRSEEILTGALPSAEAGLTIVETTWKGGRGGHLWPFVERSLAIPLGDQEPGDFRLLFFPWWKDPRYSSEGDVKRIEPEVAKYLDEREAELGITFTPGQRVWYAATRRKLREWMLREYPTTLDECWQAPVEGAIYAADLDKLRVAGRITPNVHERGALVHTCWDLGAPENMAVWYFQMVGREVYLVDHDEGLDLTTAERVARMLAKGYSYGWHLLPHDAGAKQKGGRTFEAELRGAGLVNTRVVPRCVDIWRGINRVRDVIPRMWIDRDRCKRGLECLMAYRRKADTAGGWLTDVPVHDWASHSADALRTFGEAELAGLLKTIPGGHRVGRRPQARATMTVGG